MFRVVNLTLSVPCLVAAWVSKYQLRVSTKSIFPLQLLPNTDWWVSDMQKRKAVVSLLPDPYPSFKALAWFLWLSLHLLLVTAVLSWVLDSTTFLLATRSAYQWTAKACILYLLQLDKWWEVNLCEKVEKKKYWIQEKMCHASFQTSLFNHRFLHVQIFINNVHNWFLHLICRYKSEVEVWQFEAL